MFLKATILIVAVCFQLSVHAFNDLAARCEEADYLATRLCAVNDPTCSTVAQDCVTKCTRAVPTAGSITEGNYIKGQLERCQGFTASTGHRESCVSAHQALLACHTDCQPQYEACVSQCRNLPNPVEVTEYINRCNANRNGGARPPADATGDQEPVDPNGEESAGEETPVSAELDPAATGNPNPAVQPMPEIVATESGTGALANTNPGDINFTPNIGGSIQAQSPPIESGGYAGTASGTDDVFAGEQVGGPPANNNSGASSAGGGGGPMGNPGMPMGAGASGAGARPGGTAANNRRGGPSRNGAAEYLSRHSPFAYQTPPGGTANGGAARGSRTVANKKGTPPRYNKKENDGRDALNRLFGEGMAPSSYRRNPYGAGSGKNCLDSVFCPVEVFYNKIERFPNHEINPDSF